MFQRTMSICKMSQKPFFQFLLFTLSFTLICTNTNSLPVGCGNTGTKVAPGQSTEIRVFPRSCVGPAVGGSGKVSAGNSLQKRLERQMGKNFVKSVVTPQQVPPSNVYQHQLDGEWTYVAGHVGFFHSFSGLGEGFVSIIGLRTTPSGNNNYITQEYDRKAFWMDIGDGLPMHLGAEYFVEYIDEQDESFSVIVYNCYNLLYRQAGKKYNSITNFSDLAKLELYTDLQNNFIDYAVIFEDENGEEIETRQFVPGDQVIAGTTLFLLDDPDTIYIATMEDDFRTIDSQPEFMYEHMSPNVDFPNPLTQDLIDFPKQDLLLTLFGSNLEDDAETPFQFSQTKELGFKWDGTTATSVIDWVYHLFE